jgi:hypothetical protein
MGGNAFAAPAARLSIAEYEALRLHLLERLDAFGPVDTAPYLTSKASHGDVDVLVGWDKAGWENGKGRGEGKVDPSKIPVHKDTLTEALAAAGVAHVTLTSSPEEIATWCDTIAAHIGGTHWYRSGAQLSLAIPIDVVRAAVEQYAPDVREPETTVPYKSFKAAKGMRPDESVSPPSETAESLPVASPPPAVKQNHLSENHPYADLQPHAFAQVDLLLLPPPGVAFQRFTHGYGAMVLLLSQLLRRASFCRDFILHGHCTILRWAPYPGCPKAEVQLTHDPAALCAYLGLDYAKWEQLSPATTEDLFAWLADCDEESRAARGLRQLARFGLVDGTYKNQGGVSRLPVLDEFGAWLREKGWVPGDGHSPKRAPAALPDAGQETGQGPAAERKPELPEPKDAPKESTEGVSEQPELKKVKTVIAVPPDSPRPLPSAHAALVRFWGKEAEYAAAVEAIRPAAEVQWAGQERRKVEAERKAAEEAASTDGAKVATAAAKMSVPTCIAA